MFCVVELLLILQAGVESRKQIRCPFLLSVVPESNCDCHFRFLLPGEVGGNVDKTKLLLLIPQEHCNDFHIEPTVAKPPFSVLVAPRASSYQ